MAVAAAAWFVAVAPALGAVPSFTGPTAFNAGSTPSSVVAADVNTDGKPDLITANSYTNGAGGNTVLINTTPTGNATPTFTGPTPFNAGNTPWSVVAADVNGDGRPDLITANRNTFGAGGNTVLINTTVTGAPTPSFSVPTPFNAGNSPGSVVAADVNTDGKPDLITANQFTNGAGGSTVLINATLTGAATPIFSGPTAFDAGFGPRSVVAADVNTDGKPDLITANNSTNAAGGNTVLINTTPTNNPTPSFSSPTAFPAGINSFSVVAADLNTDGKPDLITANYGTNGPGGNTVLINTTPTNNPTPSFSGPTPFNTGPGPWSVVAADVNGDGRPDLITANNSTNGAGGNTVLINTTPTGNATPTFSYPTPFKAGREPVSVVAADVNTDGKPDLITANNLTNGMGGNTVLINTSIVASLPAVVRSSTSWALRNPNGSCCAALFNYGTKPLVPLMGDWDGNGSRTPGTYEAGTFKLNNANDDSPDLTFTFGDPRGYPVAGDFNANGTDDVAVYRNGTWQIRLSDGTIPPAFTYGPGGAWPATIPVSGDWDGNGTDGIGTYTYDSATWNLRHTASTGGADAGSFPYGTPNSSYPVVGDWDADAIDTIGVKTGQTWTLRNANAPGPPDTAPFIFGNLLTDLPLSWHP